MQAVSIFRWQDTFHCCLTVEVGGKRKLHNHAADVWSRIEVVNRCENVGLSHIGIELDIDRDHADCIGILVFVANI